MATSRLDLDSPIGQYMWLPDRGFMLGIGVGAQYTTTNSVGGVAGNPITGEVGWGPGAIFFNPITTIPGNFTWLNVGSKTSALWRNIDGSGAANDLITLTAATVLTAAANAGRTMLLGAAAGFLVTLPAPTGTGNIYKFFTSVTVTSVGVTIDAKPADASAVMSGISVQAGTVATGIFATASNTNLITLNGTTTGGVLGDWIEITDVALHQWSVRLMLAGGAVTAASPFSNH